MKFRFSKLATIAALVAYGGAALAQQTPPPTQQQILTAQSHMFQAEAEYLMLLNRSQETNADALARYWTDYVAGLPAKPEN